MSYSSGEAAEQVVTTSTRISWEQTPRGRNVYVMVEISSFHDIARLGYHIPPGMARGGTI